MNQDAGERPEWLVGLARADITPKEPIRMGGYGARVKPSEGVLDPLMAKALAIESPGAEPAVLVTSDLISFDAGFADLIFEDVRKRTGLERGRIILNSSHTHSGPIFGVRYPVCYGLDPEEPAPIAVWQFGGDLTLVRLSGEVVGDYIQLIERAIGPLGLRIAAYCDDYFGYLPSTRVHREGGYESHDFITGFGYLAASVEPIVLAKVHELAQRTGRKW